MINAQPGELIPAQAAFDMPIQFPIDTSVPKIATGLKDAGKHRQQQFPRVDLPLPIPILSRQIARWEGVIWVVIRSECEKWRGVAEGSSHPPLAREPQRSRPTRNPTHTCCPTRSSPIRCGSLSPRVLEVSRRAASGSIYSPLDVSGCSCRLSFGGQDAPLSPEKVSR